MKQNNKEFLGHSVINLKTTVEIRNMTVVFSNILNRLRKTVSFNLYHSLRKSEKIFLDPESQESYEVLFRIFCQ